MEKPTGLPSMLNEKQTKMVVQRVNKDFNIPLVSEGREEKWLEGLMEKVNPVIEPSLLALMPTVYVESLKISLNESIPINERKEKISKLMRDVMAEPLSKQLNDRVEIAWVPEVMEGKVLKVVANAIIDKFVESSVGGV